MSFANAIAIFSGFISIEILISYSSFPRTIFSFYLNHLLPFDFLVILLLNRIDRSVGLRGRYACLNSLSMQKNSKSAPNNFSTYLVWRQMSKIRPRKMWMEKVRAAMQNRDVRWENLRHEKCRQVWKRTLKNISIGL